MEKQFVIGLDYGSDSARAVIVNVRTGEIVATSVQYYPRWRKGLYCDPATNRYRQHPSDYIEVLEASVKEALAQAPAGTAEQVIGIAFDTTGSTPAFTDAAGVPLGRLASQVAMVLKGKKKPEYTPNVDVGDFVIVINTDKVALTGNKAEKKLRTYHTGYMGGLKQQKYSLFLEENSDKAVIKAVKGMLPKNSLGRQMIKKLKVFKGATHNHEAQKPEPLEIAYNKEKR